MIITNVRLQRKLCGHRDPQCKPIRDFEILIHPSTSGNVTSEKARTEIGIELPPRFTVPNIEYPTVLTKSNHVDPSDGDNDVEENRDREEI